MNVKIADRVRTAVTVTAALIMLYALFVSADHITHVARVIGLEGYQAATLFVLIDIPALVGKALRLKYFAAVTRKWGLRLMLFSGVLSLTCNITSGALSGGMGAAGYGAFVVFMFLLLEHVVTKIKPSAGVTKAKNAMIETQPAQALTPAQRGAITRARNKATRAQAAK